MSSFFQMNGGDSSNSLRGSSSSDLSSEEQEGSDFFSNPVVEAIFTYGWIIVVMYCTFCKRRPERSTRVGDEIRQRAREYQERRQRQKEKEEQPMEERRKLVLLSLNTKRVLSQDENGNWKLGNVDAPVADDIEQGDITQEGQETGYAASADDEDQTCVICIEPFLPRELVSWSRHSKTCTHVFHTECIRPWLEDRRQDECPSCRSTLVCYPCTTDDAEITTENGENQDDSSSSTSSDESSRDESEASSDDDDSPLKEESFFVIMHGLISRAMPRMTRPPSSYNLVSINSNSFDSSDSQVTVTSNDDDQEPLSSPSTTPQKPTAETDDDDSDSYPDTDNEDSSPPPSPTPLLPPPSPLRRVLSDSSDESSTNPLLTEPIEFRHVVSDVSRLHPRMDPPSLRPQQDP